MSGWTKGPWLAGVDFGIWRGDKRIATTVFTDPISQPRDRWRECEANHNLIAAAPELAEAADEAREFVKAYSAIPDQPAGHFQQRAKLALDKIDAALAKARGE